MKNNTSVLLVVVLAVLLIVIAAQAISQNKDDTIETADSEQNIPSASTNQPESNMSDQQYSQPPTMQIDEAKQYQATLKTSEGEITIELNAAATPVTVNNFVFLAREGFYNGTIFHRTLDGFMIQGGDPEGTGSGGPGYRFDDEPFEGEYTQGTVAMANAGPNTNGSQFFIMHQDYPLPPNYVIFGQVVSGMEVVDAIATAPTATNASGENSQPVNPTTVESVTITEK